MSSQIPNIVISYPIGDDDCALQETRNDFFTGLSEWADVTLVNPRREIPDKLESQEVDLYHMGKRRAESLNNLQYAEEYGVETINSASGARRVNNRVAATEMMEDLGISVPEWDLGRSENVDISYPAVAKTPRETEEGKHDIDFLSEDEPGFEGRKLVQEYIDHDEVLKIYNVGEEVRAVRLRDDQDYEHIDPRQAAAEEINPPEYVEQYAEDIREATGLELFEADIIEDGRVMLDVNSVPFLADTEDGMSLYEQLINEKAF